jgi:outer membrane receptor protein involved in Fe transport
MRVRYGQTLQQQMMAGTAALVLAVSASPALAQSRTFNVSAGPANRTIPTFAKQAGVQILAGGDIVRGKRTNSVRGAHPVNQALQLLLNGTGLSASGPDSTGIVTIRASRPIALAAAQSVAGVGTSSAAGQSISSGTGQAQTASSLGDGENSADTEIIVTAQKRNERLLDVPVPVSVVAGQTLSDTNQSRIQDYYTRIPGLSLAAGDLHGAPILVIRGLTTGGVTNPTVGIMVDDIPFGATSLNAAGHEAPDLDPSDLAQIEVLRGPQGTLYGASSLGGLLKFVTLEPSTDRFSGRLQAGVATTQGAETLGWSTRGALNIPLADTFALRVSGYARRDAGYIDNPILGLNDLNETRARGFRFTSLWRPSDALSVKLSALNQTLKSDGSSQVWRQPGLGDLDQASLPGAGFFEKQLQAYSLTVKARLGGAELVSLTGYNISKYSDLFDFASPFFNSLSQAEFGVSGTVSDDYLRTKKFTQEVRLEVPVTQSIDWMIGGFYTDERTRSTQLLNAADPTTGALAGTGLAGNYPSTYEEVAAFTNATVRFSEEFDLQLGGRLSENRQTYEVTFAGPFSSSLFGTNPFVQPLKRSKDSSFTYLITPRWRPAENLMVYGRFASGYRPGGPNSFGPSIFGVPDEFGPDRTDNFEVGFKGEVAGKLLTVDASLYYTEWRNLQLQVFQNGAGFTTNGSRARSQGFELTLESRPSPELFLSAAAAFNDAELTEDFPVTAQAVGREGDRLPYTPRFSGNLSADWTRPVSDEIELSLGGSIAYVGSRHGVFNGSGVQQVLPDYVKVDLRVALRITDWELTVFANNLTDERGVLAGGIGTFNPVAFSYIQPRTIGVSIAKSF